MRTAERSILVLLAAALVVAAAPSQAADDRCGRPERHSPERHTKPRGHRKLCGMDHIRTEIISPKAGLGRIAVRRDIAAVLRRDEGIVTLVDIGDPSDPHKLGSFDNGAQDSLDGDVAFSGDGKWLFYARQTEQFSEDGIHVLDVSAPDEPARVSYQPGGGSYRVAYYRTEDSEYVMVLDAVDGLVVYRFVRESGTLVRVFQDAMPALKVGGPASAGIYIDRKDPKTETPLMYVTTGRTGLQVYDLSRPEAPTIVGTWDDVGLAEVEVRATPDERTIYAATEYWFDSSLKPEIVVLDASNLGRIRQRDRFGLGLPADDLWRVQGMDLLAGKLFVAHSHAGLVVFGRTGRIRGGAALPQEPHPEAGAVGAPYAMDVVATRDVLFVTDAASGAMSALTPHISRVASR